MSRTQVINSPKEGNQADVKDMASRTGKDWGYIPGNKVCEIGLLVGERVAGVTRCLACAGADLTSQGLDKDAEF